MRHYSYSEKMSRHEKRLYNNSMKIRQSRNHKGRGLKRPYVVQVFFNEDEKEFIARQSFEAGLSDSTFIRQLAIKGKWKNSLDSLRSAQRLSVREFDGRRR